MAQQGVKLISGLHQHLGLRSAKTGAGASPTLAPVQSNRGLGCLPRATQVKSIDGCWVPLPADVMLAEPCSARELPRLSASRCCFE